MPKMLDNWTTDKMRAERDGAFVCDKCGERFVPEEGCYIGPKDRDDDRCCPVTALVGGGWENLCAACNLTHGRY
jgi:hypothetical protein